MHRSRSGSFGRNASRWKIGAVAAAALVLVGAGLGVASAAEEALTVDCPRVTVDVAVPSAVATEVQANLDLLDKQIAEADERLASTSGRGDSAFIQNAVLGPLKDKRFATIERIETAIGRRAAKPDLDAEGLSACVVEEGADRPQQPTEPEASPANPGAGLDVLANDCSASTLTPHDGFQNGDRCVTTEFGEVGAQENNPTLLITQAPRSVSVNQPFTITVSTRNLIRDRFLAAGQGGYYVESSVLRNGLVRGHFHTACRMLAQTTEAPVPEPAPAFFVATEDSKGDRAPDLVRIQVPGMPTAGTAQCAAWAGDGSHRIPMMQRANQTPAFDAVRIRVR